MKLEKTTSYYRMIREIEETFGEYYEMGYSLEIYLLSRLHAEREKNFDLKKRIEYLERKINDG
jgi:hypothetical protein